MKPIYFAVLWGLVLPVSLALRIGLRIIQNRPIDYPQGDYIFTLVMAIVLAIIGYFIGLKTESNEKKR